MRIKHGILPHIYDAPSKHFILYEWVIFWFFIDGLLYILLFIEINVQYIRQNCFKLYVQANKNKTKQKITLFYS